MELRSEALITALEATTFPLIEVRDPSGRFLAKVSKPVALAAAGTGLYIGVGNPKRVRRLCQIAADDRPFPVDAAFHDGRAIFWWPSETSRGMVSRSNEQLYRRNESRKAPKLTRLELADAERIRKAQQDRRPNEDDAQQGEIAQ